MQVSGCRICGGDLVLVLDLGFQPLSSVFPLPGEAVPEGSLELCKCERCNLVQLADNCPTEVWGEGYGYRSGLNASMVKHLGDIVDYAKTVVALQPGDHVVDIGSNDGTLLGHYPDWVQRVGFDPTTTKFAEFIPDGVRCHNNFFSAEAMGRAEGGVKVKVVTSIACFYDLAEPLEFVNDILEVLADDGIWISEQSYLPSMVKARSFDTICHEHLQYYTLRDFHHICSLVGLEIVGVNFNKVNGGSFRVTMRRAGAGHRLPDDYVAAALSWEEDWRGSYQLQDFAAWVPGFRDRLRGFFCMLPGQVQGYGASTKGNILLNYCDIDSQLIPRIADVNPDKWGKVTPGSNIPIVSEVEAARCWNKSSPRHAFFVLPWHFRNNIIRREAAFRYRGGILWFPLPEHEFVSGGQHGKRSDWTK